MGAIKLIDKEINEYLAQLDSRQKQAVLSMVKTIATGQQDWWDSIDTYQQKAIDQSMAEMKAGKVVPHDEVMKKYKQFAIPNIS